MIKLKVREIAESRGWNAGRLGRAARISNAAMYGIWNGITADPGVQTLGAIARALDVSLCDLCEEDGTDLVVGPKSDANEDGSAWGGAASETNTPTAEPSSFVTRPVAAVAV